ncbi:MAG TPA: hypothetical protein PKY77_04400 [Phycisphaerae bacterium]|nr:hypothetical protein [Phycisphaerae bacterium]HRY67099.1 hypothetical protein [Phycisphaerae bacterium]HSA26532.1 hypothetical protein [Phycisphaerae bacterium]
MSTGVSFTWVMILIVPLVGGLLLLVGGLHTRRRGHTPHCRNCEYNLTGLTSDHCPECGTEVTPFTIAYGEPRRRPRRAVAGAALLLLAAALMVGAVGNFDWYSLFPTALLIYQTSSGDPATASKAWNELDRRIRAGQLSAGQHARLIDLALKEQGATGKPMRGNVIDYLGDCYFRGLLSQAQQKLFFDQMTTVKLTVRPTVILGDSVPYEVSHQSRSPSTGMWYRVGIGQGTSLDGKALPGRGDRYGSGSGGGGGSMSTTLECKVPGKHALKVTPEVAVFSGTSFDENTSTVLNKRNIPLEATFEVLASEPPDYIRATEDPSQAERLKSTITPNQFRWQRSFDAKRGIRYGLNAQIELKRPPVDVAFDVMARINGKEYRVGSIHLPRGKFTNWGIGHGDAVLPEQAAKVDVILRGSKKVARATVAQFSYWDGELVYEDVPVEMVATNPAPDSTAAP